MTEPAPDRDDTRISRTLRVLLDGDAAWVYLLVLAVATLPILIALLIGAGDSVSVHCTAEGREVTTAHGSEVTDPGDVTFCVFRGYLVVANLNWLVHVLLAPFEVWLLRWILNTIGPVQSPRLPNPPPPVIGLMKGADGQRRAYSAMRARLLSRTNLWIGLGVTAAFTAIDTWSPFAAYRAKLLGAEDADVRKAAMAEHDWTNMFFADDGVDLSPNLALFVTAYASQFMLVFLISILIVLVVRHHAFFISRIYQRRHVPPGRETEYIAIDLDDWNANRCFGLGSANHALNKPVQMLAIATGLTLFSRFSNTERSRGGYDELLSGNFENIDSLFGLLFPDVGQVMVLLFWFFGLGVAIMPVAVKILPRWPPWNPARHVDGVESFLREYLPDHYLPFDEKPSGKQLSVAAAKFASNHFWPTGNHRARFLFFGAFAAAYLMILPFRPSLTVGYFVYVLVGLLIATGLTALLFLSVRMQLNYIDPRLSTPEPAALAAAEELPPQPKIACATFICYRRTDEAAAALLELHLARLIAPGRLFRDRRSIDPGEDFPTEIADGLDASDAVLVVIGEGWQETLVERARDPDTLDYVRHEVHTALVKGKHVIPILVDGAPVPAEAGMPEDVAPLLTLNMAEIATADLEDEAGRVERDPGGLIAVLEKIDPGSTRPAARTLAG